MNRERVVRTLTFWLRPEFVLRVVNRFQKVAGFDRDRPGLRRPHSHDPAGHRREHGGLGVGGKDAAERITDRYDLTGGGAEAVTEIFLPPMGSSTSIGIIGRGPELHRGVQRLFEQTWELEPLSVRNTFEGLLWIGGLALYLAVSGILQPRERQNGELKQPGVGPVSYQRDDEGGRRRS